MSQDGLWRLTAAELLDGYRRRAFSPVEVVDEAIERIDALNPLLHAYLAVDRERARQAASKAEAQWRSPGEKPVLCGVPVSVKDTIEMDGLPTTYGSLPFKDNLQPDAEIVLRLKRAGAVILGKTNTPEFALCPSVDNRLGPPGANPWNVAHTCGGSSGGAGAAVAAGLGPLAVGTDSGGSIRVPAAYNGIYGLKPSYQRIPAVQVWRAAPGRSHNGPMTRTVRDSALMMHVLAGYHPGDIATDLPEADYLAFADAPIRRPRVAISFGGPNREQTLDPEVRATVERAAELLRDMGCLTLEADPPERPGTDDLEPGVWAYSGDHYNAAESMIPGFWDKHADKLTDYARPIYDAGRRALAWQYRRILRRNSAFVYQMDAWFQAYDFLLYPMAGPAPRIEDTRPTERGNRSLSFASPFNFSQNPAASVPFGFHSNGLPLAVQIVGRRLDDVGVLRLSAAIEAAQPWATAWPALAEGPVALAVAAR